MICITGEGVEKMPTTHQATPTSDRELVLTRIINAPSPLALLGAILTAALLSACNGQRPQTSSEQSNRRYL